MNASKHIPLLCLTSALICAALLSVFPVNDTDVWWQLKTGEIILKSGALPVRDVFTFSIPEQTRWHDSQWMFQIIAAGVFKLGGWNALIGLRALLVCVLALVLWLWLRDRGCPPVHSIGAVLIVLLASRYRLSVRPELLAFPCAALELWLFDRAARTGRLSFVPTMFIIQWFWANAHSSCIVGCFLALAFCAQDLPHNWRKPRSLIVLFGFILVSLVNPNGWIQLVYGVTEVHKSHIMELQPPGWSLVLSAMIFALLAPLGGLGVLRSRYQRFLLIVYCCFLLAALRIIRFFPYYAIAVAPLIAEAARKWRDLKPVSRSNPWRLIHAAFPVCVVMACAAVSLSNNKKKFLKMGVVEEQFPRAAADFVISRNLNGRFFNTMRDGGFLAWRFYPDRKIFVFPDTRVNNAPLERLIAINSSESMRMLISDYQIDCAIYPCYSRLPGETPDFSVFDYFQTSPEWSMIFWDDAHAVFVKNIAAHRDLISSRTCVVSPRMFPWRGDDASNLEAFEGCALSESWWPRARNEMRRVVAESSSHFRALFGLGFGSDLNGDSQAALAYYEQAERMDPSIGDLMALLAEWHARRGNHATAAEYCRRAGSLHIRDARARKSSANACGILGLQAWTVNE